MPRISSDRERINQAVNKVLHSRKLGALIKQVAEAIERAHKTETPAAGVEPKRGPGRPRKEEGKRGPGRPRKVEAETPVKRGPGRPRKTEATTPPAPKRGPGRPRKTETEVKRGPGRPRKVKEDEAESENEAEKVVLLVRPKEAIDWWPTDGSGKSQWATVDPAGGYVMNVEPSYAIERNIVNDAREEWNQDHEDREWEFDVLAAPPEEEEAA